MFFSLGETAFALRTFDCFVLNMCLNISELLGAKPRSLSCTALTSFMFAWFVITKERRQSRDKRRKRGYYSPGLFDWFQGVRLHYTEMMKTIVFDATTWNLRGASEVDYFRIVN